MFFSIFGFFLKIYQNMGQKLGSNRCPLFTMLTKQKSSMFCIVSFVKKNLSFCLLNLLNIHSFKDFTFFFFLVFLSFYLSLFVFINLRSHLATSFTKTKECCSSVNLKSHMEIPFNQSYVRSHLATSLNQKTKKKYICNSVNLKSHLAIPFNQSYMRSHLATSFNWNENMCKSVNLKSHLAIPFNQSYMRSHLATSFNWNEICVTRLT